MQNDKLKYLFLAEFTDGTTLEQHPEDKSALDPEKRNTYYDLLQSGKTIKKFSLIGNEHKVSVDLTTGLFEVDGFPILLESEKLPLIPERFELIYYKQTTENQNITIDKQTGKIIGTQIADAFTEHF